MTTKLPPNTLRRLQLQHAQQQPKQTSGARSESTASRLEALPAEDEPRPPPGGRLRQASLLVMGLLTAARSNPTASTVLAVGAVSSGIALKQALQASKPIKQSEELRHETHADATMQDREPPLEDRPVQLGLGGVLVSHFNFTASRSLSANSRKTEATTHRDVVPVLKEFLGKDKVKILQGNKGTPFLRNVVAEGPSNMITSGVASHHPQYGPLRNQVERYFDRAGVKYQRMASEVNMANVEFLPESRLLVLADSDPKITPFGKAELERVFGNPENVIHLALDKKLVNNHGAPLCYDLDLAFHALVGIHGERVALIHQPCIQSEPDRQRGIMGRADVLKTLKALGYSVIEIDAEDQQSLAANSLSLDDSPGKILFTSDKVSDSLRNQLQTHGIEPSFPSKGKDLGHRAYDGVAGYGIHCLTVSLRLPEAEITKPENEGVRREEL